MSTGDDPQNLADKLKPAVMVLRLIVVALILGVLAFASAAFFIRQTGEKTPADAPLEFLTWMALGAAAMALVASWALPVAIVKKARRAIASGTYPALRGNTSGSPFAWLSELGDAGKLAAVYLTATIVGVAVLEGAAFVNLVAYLVNGNLANLAAGVAIVLPMAAMIAGASRLAIWILEQLRLMADEKMLGQ